MLKFKGSWRNYQKRILEALEFHLRDKKLHIVAAPGAGKTTLGIEVISRIKRRSLILCPTNTIKNQWRDRICEAFLEENEYDNVSTDIKNPKYITVTTYQALLAAFCEGKKTSESTADISQNYDYTIEEEIEISDEEADKISSSVRFSQEKADEIIKILKKAKISLLCFDEAHHLRKEWWRALNYLVDELAPEQTVALTATPPYDVDYSEWERYEQLCGEIDETISIPELVQNNDLCPHQDFIYFSLLRENESAMLKKYNKNVGEFLSLILSDRELFEYLAQMSFLKAKENDIEKIFEDPEFYVSIASVLNSAGKLIPNPFLKLFNAKQSELPSFNLSQTKNFLNGFLINHTDEFIPINEKREKYLNMAKRMGLIQNKKIVLNDNLKVQKQIAHSMGKLDSIVEIVEIENASLGQDLRMVILTDFIKANDTDNSNLGVVPIWRTLKNKYGDKITIGVLCGSLIIIPENLKNNIYQIMKDNNVSPDNITITSYKEDENYIKITPKDSAKHCIVSLITQMFNRGDITVLIGTQALLGEGWDAPATNSLILSSTVSSFMLSNQMRGRAIRINKNNPNKVSNIWHLASVQIPKKSDYIKNAIFKETITDDDITMSDAGMNDINALSKRFEGFEAPSYYANHEITSGISRVIPDEFLKSALQNGERQFIHFNEKSKTIAQNRNQTKTWWQQALTLPYNNVQMSLKTGVLAPKIGSKSLCYTGYKQIFLSVVGTFLVILYYIFDLRLIFWQIFALWFVALLIAMGYVFIKYIKTGSIAGVLKQVAIVNLETLSHLGFIKTSLKQVGIEVKESDGYFVTCKNLSTEENNLLIKCIQEFLDPIDNPRYILIKRDTLMNSIQQTDYFSIPSIISGNRKDVDIFKQLWEKYIGKCDVKYTRNFEGRKLLLQARKTAFSESKRPKSKKLSKWQ